MRHAVRQVEEERPVPIGLEESDRLIGISSRELSLVRLLLDHLFAAKQGDGGTLGTGPPLVGGLPHVIRERNPEVVVEPLPRRQELRLIPQVPLADAGRRIAFGFEDLSQGDLLRIEPAMIAGEEDPASELIRVETDPFGVTARQDRRPGRRADPAGDVKIGELSPLRRKLDEVRRLRLGSTERLDVCIPQVVAVDDDEVRGPRILTTQRLGPRRKGRLNEHQDREHPSLHFMISSKLRLNRRSGMRPLRPLRLPRVWNDGEARSPPRGGEVHSRPHFFLVAFSLGFAPSVAA